MSTISQNTRFHEEHTEPGMDHKEPGDLHGMVITSDFLKLEVPWPYPPATPTRDEGRRSRLGMFVAGLWCFAKTG